MKSRWSYSMCRILFPLNLLLGQNRENTTTKWDFRTFLPPTASATKVVRCVCLKITRMSVCGRSDWSCESESDICVDWWERTEQQIGASATIERDNVHASGKWFASAQCILGILLQQHRVGCLWIHLEQPSGSRPVQSVFMACSSIFGPKEEINSLHFELFHGCSRQNQIFWDKPSLWVFVLLNRVSTLQRAKYMASASYL